MRRWMFTLSLVCSCFASFSQYDFRGKVVDESSHPISGVIVLYDESLFVQTDSVGNFKIDYSDSVINLTFSRVGFVSRVLKCSSDQFASISLERDVPLLEETIVRAFEINANVSSVAAAVSVISNSTINRFPSQSFVSAFNSVAGVKMEQRSPGSYRLNIRGNLLRSAFGVRNVKVYWNGIPFTDATGTTYLNELSPAIVDKIEIIKGPSGSMYGAGTGGVVLLNSTSSASVKKQVTLEGSAGNFGTYSGTASYESRGKANQVFSYSHAQTSGYREQSGMRRDVGNYILSIPTGAASHLNANIFYSDLYYQTPGGLTQAEVIKDPSGARPAAGAFQGAVAQKASLHLKTLYSGIGYDNTFGKRWRSTSGIYGTYTDFTNPTIRNYERKFERGIGGRSVLQFKNARFTHTIGGEFQSGFINTRVSGNRLGVKDTLQYHDIIAAKQANAFLQTVLIVRSNISLEAGVSYNKFFYGFRRPSIPFEPNLKSHFKAQVIPRIAALVKIRSLNFYLALSKGYSPPSIDEIHASNGIFNKGLAAETSLNYEAGLKGVIVKNKLWVDLSYYIFKLKNTIVSRRDSSGADYYVNAGTTNQHGIEATLKYHAFSATKGLIRDLAGWANVAKTAAHFLRYQQGINNFDGNQLTGTPSLVLGVGFDVKVPCSFYLHANLCYTSKIPLNDANTFYSNRYNLLNTKLGKNVGLHRGNGVELYVAYERSFNNPYSLGNDLNAAGNRYYNPSAPYSITVGAKLDFNLK